MRKKATLAAWWEMPGAAMLCTNAIAFSAMARTATAKARALLIWIRSPAILLRLLSNADLRPVEVFRWIVIFTTRLPGEFTLAECHRGNRYCGKSERIWWLT
jgi:hypothetical protein